MKALDLPAIKKRCEARLPTMGWTSSGNRYLTAEGHDYIRQLRTDCTAALEALEEAQGKIEAVTGEATFLKNQGRAGNTVAYDAGDKEDE